MKAGATVREIRLGDESVWRELWAGYLDFYEVTLPDTVTNRTWGRIVSPDATIQGIVAEVDGEVIGFANVVLHDFTWSDRPAGLLHDLYVRPDVRGGGAGRALIQHVIDQGKREGWNRVYWLTKEDNAVARRLYDTFAPADGFVRYRIGL